MSAPKVSVAKWPASAAQSEILDATKAALREIAEKCSEDELGGLYFEQGITEGIFRITEHKQPDNPWKIQAKKLMAA